MRIRRLREASEAMKHQGLETTIGTVGRANARPDKIVVESVSKSFDGMRALDRVSLKVRSGEFLSIVGPSGCGKSTLLYMVGGFVMPTEGRIVADGKEVKRPGVDRGVVFQEYALFPWLSVAENIAYPLKRLGKPADEQRTIVRRYLDLMGLAQFADAFPRTLSGGMKQRVALARTFAYDPDILLLDEPFGALDSQTREIMQEELLRLWRSTGKTVVMVTHDVDEAVYLSSRICVMSQRPGRFVREFAIDLDQQMTREEMVLSEQYRRTRNAVWLSVREQVVRPGMQEGS